MKYKNDANWIWATVCLISLLSMISGIIGSNWHAIVGEFLLGFISNPIGIIHYQGRE